MSEDAAVRVERGSAWLDEQYPGWFASIDLMSLDVAHGDKCVLGQVFGQLPADRQERMRSRVAGRRYWVPTVAGRYNGYTVMVFLHELFQAGLPYGFWQGFPFGPNSLSAKDLNEEWIRVIISRLMGDVTMESLEEQVAA